MDENTRTQVEAAISSLTWGDSQKALDILVELIDKN